MQHRTTFGYAGSKLWQQTSLLFVKPAINRKHGRDSNYIVIKTSEKAQQINVCVCVCVCGKDRECLQYKTPGNNFFIVVLV